MIHKFLILVTFALLTPFTASPQGNEILITTSSEEARNMFIAGRQKKENIQTVAAENLFIKIFAFCCIRE